MHNMYPVSSQTLRREEYHQPLLKNRDRTPPATAPLATGQEGRPGRRRHSQAPCSPLSNQRKPISPQCRNHEWRTREKSALASTTPSNHEKPDRLRSPSTNSAPRRRPHSPGPFLPRSSKKKTVALHVAPQEPHASPQKRLVPVVVLVRAKQHPPARGQPHPCHPPHRPKSRRRGWMGSGAQRLRHEPFDET